MDAQTFFERYNERMYDEVRPHKNYVDAPADSKPRYVQGNAQDEATKARRRAYQREYEKRTKHPCLGCGKAIARQATRCRACQHKLQQEGKVNA